jgi:hypothetical protein
VHVDFSHAKTSVEMFVLHNYHTFWPVQLGIQLASLLGQEQAAQNIEHTRPGANLIDAQDVLNHCMMNVIPPVESKAYQDSLKGGRAAISEQEFVYPWEQGWAMTTRQVIQSALNQPFL